MPTATAEQDIREVIFSSIRDRRFCAEIITEQDGVIAGTKRLRGALEEMGIDAELYQTDGAEVKAGSPVVRIVGTAKQIAVAEEFAIGMLAKPSGIATAARRAVELAGRQMRVVCGAWKKMPPEIKPIIREAVVCGGAASRITDQPFLYLDKNFVRMLGGIRAALEAVAAIQDRLKVVQLKNRSGDIAEEALTAVECGAHILMIDTGRVVDVERAHSALQAAGWRDRVQLAFAKGVRLQDIPHLKDKGIDILDIGVGIIDAPLLDMKLEVAGALHATQSA